MTAAEGRPVEGSATAVVGGVEGERQRVEEEDSRGTVALGCQMQHPHPYPIAPLHLGPTLHERPHNVHMPPIPRKVHSRIPLLISHIHQSFSLHFNLDRPHPLMFQPFPVIGEVQGEELVQVVVGAVVDDGAALVVEDVEEVD